MKEEQVTKAILKWLLNNGWRIVCFDFPQSGTGRFLHPNGTIEKNKQTINPDIVAVKDETCLFFENKDRYCHSDYLKQNGLIINKYYTKAIGNLLQSYRIQKIFYGIGLPTDKYTGSAIKNRSLVDFIVGVSEDGKVYVLFNKLQINI